MLVARVVQPGEQRMAAAGAERLFRSPQRVVPPGSADQSEMRQVDAGSGKRRCVGQAGRRQPDYPLPGAGQAGERWCQQAELANAFGGYQQLGQCPGRPAAARKLGIEPGKAGRHGRHAAGQGIAPPDAGMPQDFFESHDTVIIYSTGSGSSVPPSCVAAASGRRS